MALMICPECGKEVSDMAENCPERFDFEFIRYDEVPAAIAEKVIAEAKRDQ